MIYALALGRVLTFGPTIDAERPPGKVSRTEVAVTLDRSGRRATVIFDPSSATPVVIRHGGRSYSTLIPRRWHPWRVAVADLDGDGRQEVIVALYKTTRYIRTPHNCLFVYRYNGREVHPLWLGSTLGRPFTDFAFGRSSGSKTDSLVTLDISLRGRQDVTVHHWTGFGFRKDSGWGDWAAARLVGVRNGQVVVEADGKKIVRRLEEMR